MSRLAAMLNFAAVACMSLVVGLASGPSLADIDRAFTVFEAPDTNQLLDPCKTEAVMQRMRELDAAVERLRIKVERIEKARAETMEAMYATRDTAQRRMLQNDYAALTRWGEVWKAYKAKLERQIMYYNLLPTCAGGKRGRKIVWPGEAPVPVVGGPFTVVDTPRGCVTPEGAAKIAEQEASAKRLSDEIDQIRKGIDEDLRKLDELNARGEGSSDQAKALKARIQGKLDDIRRAEDGIRDLNDVIRELQQRFRCRPSASQQGAVRIGSCEAGVLALVNAARADPPAYGASLRGAPGRFAAEARDFLTNRPPVAALVADPRLIAAARAHADDLAVRDEASHRGAGGEGLLDRFRAQGMYVTLSAEVIAIRQNTPAGAVRSLVIDEGHPGGQHRRDLFNGLFTMTGIACVRTRSHGQLVVIDLSNAPMT
jgi:hypothetical protein